MKKGKCYSKGGKVSMPKLGGLPKSAGVKLPRPALQPTNVTTKVPNVSAAPFLAPSLTARPKSRRM